MEDDAGEQRVDESHEAIDVGTFMIDLIAARDREVNNLWQFGPGLLEPASTHTRR